MSKRDDLKRLHKAAIEAHGDWLTLVCQDAALRTDNREKKAKLADCMRDAERAFIMAADKVPNE